ncbi:MAG: nucleotidyltransferase domain-containing protein [Candidatus Cloacimonetes bacterium]|nr:nucleotidyltransferase domain-containing protein [Candidatus Cloacimonadota bacterium]
MNLPENVEEYLKHIVECVKATMPVSAIYLFGSYATGNYHEDSDLDIFIVTPDKSKKRREYSLEVRKSLGKPQKFPLDILVCHEEDFDIKKQHLNRIENEVVETGVKLYANS